MSVFCFMEVEILHRYNAVYKDQQRGCKKTAQIKKDYKPIRKKDRNVVFFCGIIVL